MKQCPYCKADIQENARFCLYCMQPLVEKTVIAPMGKKRHGIGWIIVAVLLLGGLVTALLLLPPREPTAAEATTAPSTSVPTTPPAETDPPEETDPPGETEPSEKPDPPEETDPPGETEPPEKNDPPEEPDPPVEEDPPKEPDPPEETDPPVDEDPPKEPDPPVEPDPPWLDGPPEDAEPPADDTDDHDYVFLRRTEATCTDPAMECYKCTQCPTQLWYRVAAPLGHSFTDATCTDPKICTVCNATEGEPHGHVFYNATCTAPKICTVCNTTEGSPLGHEYVDGKCTRCTLSLWGVAYPEDYHCAAHPNEGIFDLCEEASAGIIVENFFWDYTQCQYFKVPAYLDDMKIVGFTELPYNGYKIIAVYLPETIQSIEPGTFGYYATLTDIYIAGEEIDLTIEAFLTEAGSILNRGPLTIHCSATCHDSQNNLIKDLSCDNFTIIFEEWDGVL